MVHIMLLKKFSKVEHHTWWKNKKYGNTQIGKPCTQHLKTRKVLLEKIETVIKRQSMNKNPCPIQSVRLYTLSIAISHMPSILFYFIFFFILNFGYLYICVCERDKMCFVKHKVKNSKWDRRFLFDKAYMFKFSLIGNYARTELVFIFIFIKDRNSTLL